MNGWCAAYLAARARLVAAVPFAQAQGAAAGLVAGEIQALAAVIRRLKATGMTVLLIEHHMDALAYKAGTLGQRARRHLESSEHFEDLMQLSLEAQTIRHRIAYETYVDDSFAHSSKAAAIAL